MAFSFPVIKLDTNAWFKRGYNLHRPNTDEETALSLKYLQLIQCLAERIDVDAKKNANKVLQSIALFLTKTFFS